MQNFSLCHACLTKKIIFFCRAPALIVLILLLVGDPLDQSSMEAPDFFNLYGDLHSAVSLAVLFPSFISKPKTKSNENNFVKNKF